jgi:aspartate/methionine/tyrosine aminotransferase
MSKYAQRLNDIEPFRVVEVLSQAKAMAASGIDVVHMEAGEPDFATAPQIVNAAKAALDAGATYYTPALGIDALREKVSDLYKDRHGIDVPASRIIITPGASGALLLLSALLVNPGDGILMADPGYPCNRNFLRIVEGEGQLVPVNSDDNYQLNAHNVAMAWQANTVGALVASPANPTGEIIPFEQLKALFEKVDEMEGYLIVDEIYHGLSYDSEAPSILEITQQAFVINSFSKYFGMTGWRLGWLVAPEDAIEPLERLAQNLFISMSTMSQYGALAGFDKETLAVLESRKAIFKSRRDYLVPALREIGFQIPSVPEGAFYVYAGIEKFGMTSQEFCKKMLNEHAVAITPGEDFGRFEASTHVRFAYTSSMAQLEKGVARLRKALL